MKIYGIGVNHLIIGVRAYGLHLNHNTTRVPRRRACTRPSR